MNDKPLSELATIFYGKDYKSNPTGESIPIYGTGGIMGYTSIKLNSGPAILTGRKGSINNPIYLEGDFWNVDTIFCLKTHHGIDSKWLYYNLKNTDLTKLNEATGVPSVNTQSLYRLKFRYFELPQQQKIAKILSTVDTVIEKTEAAIAKYKAIKQGMMHDLFTRGIDTNTGKLRPSYQEAPELYKDSKLGMIPKEWEVKMFSNYFKLISYGFTNPMPELEEGPFMITAANVIHGKIDYNSARRTSQKLFETVLTDKSRPKLNDLLLTKDGTLGRVAIVYKENICINQSVAVIRFNEGEKPQFFKHLLESPIYQKKMLDDAGGSTIKHIYITIVDKMLLAIPEKPQERDLIVERLDAIYQKLQTEESSLSKYKQLKAGLMADLLTGRVGVSV